MAGKGIENIEIELIDTYSRREALEDGVLVAIDKAESEQIYRYPVAFTAALWAEVVRGDGASDESTRTGRTWNVLWMSRACGGTVAAGDPTRRQFKCRIGRRTHLLWVVCGPGDDSEPVLTIGFPRDF